MPLSHAVPGRERWVEDVEESAQRLEQLGFIREITSFALSTSFERRTRMQLSGPVALVTGVASGPGFATAYRLVLSGGESLPLATR
jgi:hypothetical protein